MNELLRRLLLLPPQASTYARDVDTLHYVVVLTTMAAACIIALTAAYFAVRYRASGTKGDRSLDVGTRRIERVLVGFTLAVFLAFWVFGFRQYIRIEQPPATNTIVYVTAKQWMWKFAHDGGPDEVGVLTVPRGRPVKLVMTSRDVIHSFYVPAFRLKQDVLPGRYVTAWFEATQEGRFDLFCAEYCGTSHSLMHAEVRVLSPEAYDAWLVGSRAGEGAQASLVTQGERVAVRLQCLGCHTIDGREHVGPTFRGLYGSEVVLADGRRVIADEAYLTRSMMEPMADIVAGYKPVMPTFMGQLSGPDAAALVAFIEALARPETAAGIGAPPVRSGTLEVKP